MDRSPTKQPEALPFDDLGYSDEADFEDLVLGPQRGAVLERAHAATIAEMLARMKDPGDWHSDSLAWMGKRIPQWRWAQAHFMLHKGSHCRNADDHTLLAVELLRARINMQKNLLWGSRHLIEAALIFERDEADRWLLEAHLLLPRLLCGVPRKLGISACTMKYYARFFFDVRRALKSTGWINGNALGPPPHDGYADHELSPVWKRMAYQYGERMLDICHAVTTGRGREKYTLDELDMVEFLVEQLRLSLIRFPKRVVQLQRRHEADFTGAHPSTYHMGRERPQVIASTPSPSAEGLDRSHVPRVVDLFGDRASV